MLYLGQKTNRQITLVLLPKIKQFEENDVKLYFFATPTDIKFLFQSIEQKIDICYIWGFSVPCPDALNVFNSCDEIDCFGYAIDSEYWIDIHFRDTALNLVQNANGYYYSNERVQLHICNTATKALPDRALIMNELYCPPRAKERNKELFLIIKKTMQREWKKIDGILYSPEVFREREHLVFLGVEPFSFSGQEKSSTTLETWCNSLPPEIKNLPFLCSPPEPEIHFYASSSDVLIFFQQLETQTSMQYWCGKENFRFERFRRLFSEKFYNDSLPKTFHAIDMDTHNTIDVTLGGFRVDMKNVVVPGMITYMRGCPKYGGTLLRKLNKLFEMSFNSVSVKHYGTYYLGSDIWGVKEHLIFDNGDPRFRWNEGTFKNVWRAEWEAMK